MNFIKKLLYPFTATIGFIQNHFKAMVFVLIVILIFAPGEESDLRPHNLEKISLVGPIMDATEVVKQLDEVAENDTVKGVLFDVNSPGGAVAPSIEIAYAIKRLSEKKPVVVYASGTIASGSYYASIWADEIVANPGSMVGSIGVIMQGANVQELMEKIGIKSQVVAAGKYKQVGTA
ncbi:MAG TPA: S49 family peptidase, partial [Helicobacteraceae bacterium]|nr:S49 family peptidase [Helicobacteraceae bacterium]